MTPFHLLVLAIGVFRATRLVTADTLTDSIRERLRQRTHRTLMRANGAGATETRVEDRDDRPFSLLVWRIVTCGWCSSMWLGGLAIGCFLIWETGTIDVAYVLACSAVAGILMERT